MKIVAAAAVALLMPHALACERGQAASNCAKLQIIADCSGETHCDATVTPPREDTSRAAPKKAQTDKKSPPAKRRTRL
jgi:hypothetical protein